MVPVRHQLPGGETQQPRRVGDQTGNGAGKQFIGGDVSEKGLLHCREVGLNLTNILTPPCQQFNSLFPFVVCGVFGGA